jgi:hypothetical protein
MIRTRTCLAVASLVLLVLLGLGACTGNDLPGGACSTCGDVYTNGGIACGPGPAADAWRTLADCACGTGACAFACQASFCQTLPTDMTCSDCIAMSCVSEAADCASN